jgi:hypothetical protein
MAITSTLTTSFKKELLEAVHNFKNSGGDTFKLALYTSSATIGAATTAFVTTGQATGTNYTSGGANLTRVDPTSSGTTGFTDFADLTFGTATVTARGCMIFTTLATAINQLLVLTLVAIKLQQQVTSLLYSQQQQLLQRL